MKKKEPKIYKPILDKSKSGERYRCQIIYYVKDVQKKTWGDRCDTPEEAIKNAKMKLERLMMIYLEKHIIVGKILKLPQGKLCLY